MARQVDHGKFEVGSGEVTVTAVPHPYVAVATGAVSTWTEEFGG